MSRPPSDGVFVTGVTDFDSLGTVWRDLETRAEPSFFQSWTWMGCLAGERFPDPVLVEVREGGRTVALALFNRRRGALYLGESGDPAKDSIYIEYNGVLAETGREETLTGVCLRAARRATRWPVIGRIWGPRVVLSGADSRTVAAARSAGRVYRSVSHGSPFVDLRQNGNHYLETRSPNTRQQIRRSDRGYAAAGAIEARRAETLTEALACLAALRLLHQAAWTARGQPGAFGNPFFEVFHRALIARGLPRGEIDLFHITAGARTIGYLYNFRHRGKSLSYQSGFAYSDARPREKPGLTCHHRAICFAAEWGAERYEFLAGRDRYKQSLSDREDRLYWVEIGDPWSPRAAAAMARAWLRAPESALPPLGGPKLASS